MAVIFYFSTLCPTARYVGGTSEYECGCTYSTFCQGLQQSMEFMRQYCDWIDAFKPMSQGYSIDVNGFTDAIIRTTEPTTTCGSIYVHNLFLAQKTTNYARLQVSKQVNTAGSSTVGLRYFCAADRVFTWSNILRNIYFYDIYLHKGSATCLTKPKL